MQLLHSDSLWNLFWIVPLFLILILLAASRSKRTRNALFSSARAAASFLNVDPAFRALRFAALFLAVLFAVLAAAGPAWGRRILPDAGPGRDLMVLFDVSRSMLSDDVKPDRLTQGKWLVRELVRTNPADRFGLIAFAGNAFLLCPLTIDKTSFLQLADSLDTDTIPLGGTNLQVALETAVRAFEGAQGSHKAVVVVTDGDELTGSASEVLKKLADAGIPLFIAGVGDPANPSVIPIRREDGSSSILTDSEGNTVRSPLNEPLLASLAEKSHGMYIRSTAADPGVEEINRAIARLDRRKADGTGLSLTRPIERPGTPFAISLFFLLVYLSLSEVRRRRDPNRIPRTGSARSVLPILFLAASLLCSAPLRAESPDPAAETPELSAPSGEKTLEGAPGEGEDPSVFWFNTGVRAQKEQEPEKAAAAYEKAVSSGGDPEVRAGSFQNLGILKHLDARKSFAAANASLKQQNLSEAEKSVGDSLARLADAESLYRESFRYAALNGNTGAIARNQQILLRERKAAEELKKQIEELKKLQEEARKQAEKALQDQQKQNQPQEQQNQNQQDQQKQPQEQQSQDQQKQNQQDQQKQQDQQSQDQQKKQGQQEQSQNQQGQQNQPQAQKSAQDAADAAGKLEKKAEEMSQNQLKDQAKKAGEEIRQAMDRQTSGDGRKAEEHLKNAVRMLGGEDGGQDKDKGKQKDPGSDQQKENAKDENQDQGKDKESPEKDQSGQDRQEKSVKPQTPRPAKAGEAEKKPDRAIDPEQAGAILNAMEQDEKELRDMIKEMQKRSMPQREPKKNW